MFDNGVFIICASLWKRSAESGTLRGTADQPPPESNMVLNPSFAGMPNRPADAAGPAWGVVLTQALMHAAHRDQIAALNHGAPPGVPMN